MLIAELGNSAYGPRADAETRDLHGSSGGRLGLLGTLGLRWIFISVARRFGIRLDEVSVVAWTVLGEQSWCMAFDLIWVDRADQRLGRR